MLSPLGSSWGYVETVLGYLGAMLGHLRAILSKLQAILGARAFYIPPSKNHREAVWASWRAGFSPKDVIFFGTISNMINVENVFVFNMFSTMVLEHQWLQSDDSLGDLKMVFSDPQGQ